MIVAVGSENPTKIDPVKSVFSHHFDKVSVVGVKVVSGVADQPRSQEEMFEGALTRAQAALKKISKADYGVGIEGGIHKFSYGYFENSVVVIVNKKGEVGIGASGGVVLPEKVIKKIDEGKTLEEAIDEIFGTNKIGEGIGMFGVFTKNVVTRSEGVRHGVAFALSRFLHENLY